MDCTLGPTAYQTLHPTLGTQEKGPFRSPRRQSPAQQQRERATGVEGGGGAGPGHKEGNAANPTLHPSPSLIKFKIKTKQKQKKTAPLFLPSGSLFLTSWSPYSPLRLASLLLISEQMTRPQHPLLPEHSSGPPTATRVPLQKPPSPVAPGGLSHASHLPFWLFGWLPFHSSNVSAPGCPPAPLSPTHARSHGQPHRLHPPPEPHA